MIKGTLRLTAIQILPKLWYNCGFDTASNQIIGHYLQLNISFVRPNHQFDGTIGWVNQSHCNGPLKIIINNQVDYVINDIFMTEAWYPNLIVTSTAIKETYGISFALKKQDIRLSFANYLNVFNLLIWILFFTSILLNRICSWNNIKC